MGIPVPQLETIDTPLIQSSLILVCIIYAQLHVSKFCPFSAGLCPYSTFQVDTVFVGMLGCHSCNKEVYACKHSAPTFQAAAVQYIRNLLWKLNWLLHTPLALQLHGAAARQHRNIVESHIQQVAMTARCRSVNVSDAAADTFTL